MLIIYQNRKKYIGLLDLDLLKSIQKPGSRGGNFWIDKQGKIRYGAPPSTLSRTVKEKNQQTFKVGHIYKKTIKEAEDWAKKNIAYHVDYTGCNLTLANAINSTFP